MSNKNPILLMSNYTIAIFVAFLDWRRRRRHFDFDFSRQRQICLRNFFPFLRRFSSNLLVVFLSYLPRHFRTTNGPFILKIKTVLRRSKCSSGDIKIEASSSGCRSKWRQTTFVRQQIPVCITFNDLFRKLKISFYCANEMFLPLFLTQVFVLLLYFQFS